MEEPLRGIQIWPVAEWHCIGTGLSLDLEWVNSNGRNLFIAEAMSADYFKTKLLNQQGKRSIIDTCLDSFLDTEATSFKPIRWETRSMCLSWSFSWHCSKKFRHFKITRTIFQIIYFENIFKSRHFSRHVRLCHLWKWIFVQVMNSNLSLFWIFQHS